MKMFTYLFQILDGADLTNANFTGQSLVGLASNHSEPFGQNKHDDDYYPFLINKLQLSGANLSNSCLIEAELQGANLQGANLNYANMAGARLHYAVLTGANLDFADLRETNLCGAQLQGATFNGTRFTGARFVEVNLANRNLSGLDFCNAEFVNSDLRNVNFNKTLLTGAQFHNTDLDWCHTRRCGHQRDCIQECKSCGNQSIKSLMFPALFYGGKRVGNHYLESMQICEVSNQINLNFVTLTNCCCIAGFN